MAADDNPHPGSFLFQQRTGDHFHDFCTMVGMITLTWAWGETNIARILVDIVHHTGLIDGFTKPPRAFGEQIRCLKTALNTKDDLASLKDEGLRIIDYAEGLSKRRNAFIHAAVTPIPGEPEFEGIMVAVINGQYYGREHRFSVNDAAELNHHVALLQQNLAAFMVKVSDAIEAATRVRRT